MAKIKEELILIKISTIHKNEENVDSALSDDTIYTIEQVVSEMLGDKAVVEIEILNNEE